MSEKKVYLVVQEGGSSMELYVNAFDSAELAQGFREECAHSGAYATTPPVEAPAGIESFLDEIGEVLMSLSKLEVVPE